MPRDAPDARRQPRHGTTAQVRSRSASTVTSVLGEPVDVRLVREERNRRTWPSARRRSAIAALIWLAVVRARVRTCPDPRPRRRGAAPAAYSDPVLGTIFYVSRCGELGGTSPRGPEFAIEIDVQRALNEHWRRHARPARHVAECAYPAGTGAATEAAWELVRHGRPNGRGDLSPPSDDVGTELSIDDTERSVGILDARRRERSEPTMDAMWPRSPPRRRISPVTVRPVATSTPETGRSPWCRAASAMRRQPRYHQVVYWRR